jgi:hypothetical protein
VRKIKCSIFFRKYTLKPRTNFHWTGHMKKTPNHSAYLGTELIRYQGTPVLKVQRGWVPPTFNASMYNQQFDEFTFCMAELFFKL